MTTLTTYYVIQPRLSDAQRAELNAGGTWDCPVGRTYLGLTDARTHGDYMAALSEGMDIGMLAHGWTIQAAGPGDVFSIGNGFGEREGIRHPGARSVSVGDVLLYVGENGDWEGKVVAGRGLWDLTTDEVAAILQAVPVQRLRVSHEEKLRAVEARGWKLREQYNKQGKIWEVAVMEHDMRISTRHGFNNDKPRLREEAVSAAYVLLNDEDKAKGRETA